MIMKNIIAFFFLLLVFISCGPNLNMKRAEKLYAIGEYYDAGIEYKKAYTKTLPKQRERRGEIAYKVAECNRRIKNTAKAQGAYLNAVRYNYVDTTTYFHLAEMQRVEGNYKEAYKNYMTYLDSHPGDMLAIQGAASCQAAPLWKKEGSLYTIKEESMFASRRADYSPAILGEDQIYFTSTRPAATGDEESGITGMKNADIFFIRKDEKGKWKQPEMVEGGLNTAYDEGACTFAPDGKTMYLTVCRSDPQYPRFAEIWQSVRSDASWGKAVACKLSNDTLSSFAHPAVSPDGEWLYFVSDMPGGYGGTDLWRARIYAADFGAVENLGAEINTVGNEMFPTFRPNGELYFSTDGRASAGGLDIYQAVADSVSGRWRVKHLPYPMNSQGDDFGMTFEGLHNRGYFSSNRGNGRGWDRIFSFFCPEVIQTVKGWVYEQDGYELTNSLVYMVGNDGTNVKLSVKGDGSFEQIIKPGVDYIMLATCKGYLNYRNELRVDSVKESQEYVLQFPLPSINAPVLVRNVFYEFDKATLTDDSRVALDRLVALLTENPNVTIELSAHCDYRGNDAYNELLSQKRSESVVTYLVAHGIKSDRLTAKGYGESRPKIVSKKVTEAYAYLHVGDTLTEAYIKKLPEKEQEECNALNRRTEFRVLRTTYGLFDEKGAIKPEALKKKPEEQE